MELIPSPPAPCSSPPTKMLDYGAPEDARDADDAEMEDLNPHIDPQELYGEEGGEGEAGAVGKDRIKLYSFEAALSGVEGTDAVLNESMGEVSEEERKLMGEEDVSQPPPPRPEHASELNLRPEALHLSGTPVSQCSTSRLFAYVAHWGALPLGIEWVNDESCNVVFADSASALQALELLCPPPTLNSASSADPRVPFPGQDIIQAPSSSEFLPDRFSDIALDSIFAPRRARRLPLKLYLPTEKEEAAAASLPNDSLPTLPDDIPEIYRELAAEEAQRITNPVARQNLHRLRGSLFVRFAIEGHDVKQKRSAVQSTWYRQRGREAGKVIVPRLLEVGAAGEVVPERDILDEPPPRATRPDRERERARRDLDDELDSMRSGRGGGGGSGGASRHRDRSASPVRGGNGNPVIRVRGRGSNRAPPSSSSPIPATHPEWAYADARDRSDVARAGSGAFRGRMVADELEIRRTNGGRDRTARGGSAMSGDDRKKLEARLGPRSDEEQPDQAWSDIHSRVFGTPRGEGDGSVPLADRIR